MAAGKAGRKRQEKSAWEGAFFISTKSALSVDSGADSGGQHFQLGQQAGGVILSEFSLCGDGGFVVSGGVADAVGVNRFLEIQAA